MLFINEQISIPMEEIELSAIRAQGPGGQNVNKVASAIHLRFDVRRSSLPEFAKSRVFAKRDRRMTKDGIIIIKAQRSRNQVRNKEDALERLRQIILDALLVKKARRPTKPSRGAVKRRLEAKTRRSAIKSTRRKVSRDD
ncbi:MAG: aminoacyl-tRNA hydrolase [Hyphomonadaceae bacterium]|nr:aminoacyl-tRNA hydrolase [Hyphomonadaceae bacterium]